MREPFREKGVYALQRGEKMSAGNDGGEEVEGMRPTGR